MRASNKVLLSETITKETEVHHIPVCDGYTVYRSELRQITRRPGQPDEKFCLVDEGLVTDANLDKLLRIGATEKAPHDGVGIIPAAWRELIATEGADLHNLWRLHEKDGLAMLPLWKQGFDKEGNAVNGVYSSFLDGEWGEEDLVLVGDGPLPYRRIDGRPLPVVVSSDYQGRFDRNQYDVEAAAQHLTSRPDVVAYTGDGSQRVGWPKDAQVIRPNCGELSFVWRVSEEDALKLDAAMDPKAHLKKTEFWRAVFDLDLLGLRAAGAARFDDYADGLDDDGDDAASTPGW